MEPQAVNARRDCSRQSPPHPGVRRAAPTSASRKKGTRRVSRGTRALPEEMADRISLDLASIS